MALHSDSERVSFFNVEGKSSNSAPLGSSVRVPTNPIAWNTLAYCDKTSSVETVCLPVNQTVPAPLISSWPCGPVEGFAHSIGFRYNETVPSSLTAAMVLDIRAGGVKVL